MTNDTTRTTTAALALGVLGPLAAVLHGYWDWPTLGRDIDWYDLAVDGVAWSLLAVPLVGFVVVVAGCAKVVLGAVYLPLAAAGYRTERAAWLAYYAALDAAEAADAAAQAGEATLDAGTRAWVERRKGLREDLRDLTRAGDPAALAAVKAALAAGETEWGMSARAAGAAAEKGRAAARRAEVVRLKAAADAASGDRIWYAQRTFREFARTVSENKK